MVNRVRVRFRKQGDLRLTSHRDLMRVMERLFRRAQLAICESEGFRPKPRIHYPASLALGMTGLDEVFEADLVEEIGTEELLSRLNAHSVAGLEFVAVETLPPQGRHGLPGRLRFEVPVSADRLESVRQRVEEFVAASSWRFDRDGKSVDLREFVDELVLSADTLSMRLRVTNDAGARPKDVLEVLGYTPDEILELEITRTQIELVS
jgi:radical SAM-linked protein